MSSIGKYCSSAFYSSGVVTSVVTYAPYKNFYASSNCVLSTKRAVNEDLRSVLCFVPYCHVT